MPPIRRAPRPAFNGVVIARNPGFVLHVDGHCLHASHRVSDLLGCSHEAFMAGWAQFLHPDGALFRGTLLREGRRILVHCFSRRLGGTSQYIGTTLRTLLDRDEQTVLGYIGSIRTLTVIPACEPMQQTA